jgi:hypothetical protein
MKTPVTRVHDYSAAEAVGSGFRSAVSLHSHTMHSKEGLGLLPRYIARIPLLAWLLERETGRIQLSTGQVVDFAQVYWTPPLSPREAFELERGQIEEKLTLPALVSITDHDDIEAGKLLQIISAGREIPISVEWTVPIGDGCFHLGVHNLPCGQATEWMEEFALYTAGPDAERLGAIFARLNALPDLLLVLNHPYWDIEDIGRERHLAALAFFLRGFGRFMHALEINGLRSWEETRATLRLAEQTGHPVVSGGDRHGCEPNAVLNLTRGGTFAEFVDEVRNARRSDVLILPQYNDPLGLRQFETVWHVMRDCPAHPLGRRMWSERIFVICEDGVERPLACFWGESSPAWVNRARWVMRVLASRRLRPALRYALPFEGSSL